MKPQSDIDVNNPVEVAKALVDAGERAVKQEADKVNKILDDNEHYDGSTDFEMTDEEKEALVNAVVEYISLRNLNKFDIDRAIAMKDVTVKFAVLFRQWLDVGLEQAQSSDINFDD